jgi:thiamine-monophosphate kinase
LTEAVPGHPHLYPEPRLTVGRRLLGLATAAIDVSDGLSTDLTHLCEASDVAALIDHIALPFDPLAQKGEEGLHQALHGGEDYELLFTAPRGTRIPRRIAKVPVCGIGVIRKRTPGAGRIALRTDEDKEVVLKAAGWEHFRKQKEQRAPQKS